MERWASAERERERERDRDREQPVQTTRSRSGQTHVDRRYALDQLAVSLTHWERIFYGSHAQFVTHFPQVQLRKDSPGTTDFLRFP